MLPSLYHCNSHRDKEVSRGNAQGKRDYVTMVHGCEYLSVLNVSRFRLLILNPPVNARTELNP